MRERTRETFSCLSSMSVVMKGGHFIMLQFMSWMSKLLEVNVGKNSWTCFTSYLLCSATICRFNDNM